MIDVDELNRLVKLDDKVKEALELLNKLMGLIALLSRELECNPYSDFYCPGLYDAVNKLEGWMRFLKELEGDGKEALVGSYVVNKHVDYEEGKIYELCLSNTSYLDCVHVEVSIPPTDEDVGKVKEAVRKRVKSLVYLVPEVYADLLIAMKVFLTQLSTELEVLRRNYSRLEQEVNELIKKVITK